MAGENDTEGDKTATVISFEDASHPHVHARKEAKLDGMKKSFRAVTKELLKEKRKEKRKTKKSRKKKKKK